MAQCKFCGTTFANAQGVRSHLKSCKEYRASREPREPRELRELREPKGEFLPREPKGARSRRERTASGERNTPSLAEKAEDTLAAYRADRELKILKDEDRHSKLRGSRISGSLLKDV